MANDSSITARLRLDRHVSIAPLVTFRIAFGLLMFLGIARFWWNGWISAVYIVPRFHFTYWGFEWVRPLGATGMYLLFAVVGLAALMIALGLLYRFAAVIFFLGFTYIELLDVTTYLNHYYFISLMAFLLIWLPANGDYSLDVRFGRAKRIAIVPLWCVGIIRFQMAVVYVFAGIAKLNTDWLLHAQPLRTWLPGKSHLPVVGPYMYEPWVAYLFSWFGAVYDLFIAFFLLNGSTRPIAYVFVLVFHIATAIFFPGIGLFPYVMIICSTVFFSGAAHQKFLLKLPFYEKRSEESSHYQVGRQSLITVALTVYVLVQLVVPFRYLLYPDRLFWHEEGFRFSWRVMLMEKSGVAYFNVADETGQKRAEVNNHEFLTPLQEKMMSTQPDLILKYAHFLAAEYRSRGWRQPHVYGDIYVSLNGERSRPFIDKSVDLAAQSLSWKHYSWVLPYEKQ